MTRSLESAIENAQAGSRLTVTGHVSRSADIWECDSCPDPDGNPHGLRLAAPAGDGRCPNCHAELRLHPAGRQVEVELEVELGEDGEWHPVSGEGTLQVARRPGGRNWEVKEAGEED